MKKGFTLIELLAVIVILTIIAVIATPIVIKIIDDTDKSAALRSGEFYIDALEQAVVKLRLKNTSVDDGTYDILENGSMCLKYNASSQCVDELKVEVEGEKPIGGSVDIISGEVINILIKLSNRVLITNTKKQLIEHPCKLVSGEENEVGSKYQCKVKDDMEDGFKDGYYFFVLSHNNDGTTNLIMERNMYYDSAKDIGIVATETNKALVAWYADVNDHSYGPVTAMTYLHNATKDWDNIPYMIMDYNDENIGYSTINGYESIKTTGNITIITSKSGDETGRIENLKTRMPRYDEVHGQDKCLTLPENNNKWSSCPIWLMTYLSDGSKEYRKQGMKIIDGIHGYWILSSYADKNGEAFYLNGGGVIGSRNVQAVDYPGVRPVITIKL